jgi:regulatory protein
MDETDGRIAPVIYLPGVVPPPVSVPSRPGPSVSSTPSPDEQDVDPGWNNTWSAGPTASADVEDDDDSGEAGLLAAPDAERISLRALTRRGLSQRELERTLRDRGIDDPTIEVEVERLTRVGLIDDVALAQTLVATLQERKGLGRSAIAAELTRRLLAPTAIEYALDLVDAGDELARAKELARKRASQLGSLDRDAAIRRLSSYLARRGYSGSTIRAAVDQALPARPATSVRFR